MRARERRPREQPRQPGEPHAEPGREATSMAPCPSATDVAAVADRGAACARGRQHMRDFSTQRALASLWELVWAVNRYLDARAVEAREGPGDAAQLAFASLYHTRERAARARAPALALPARGGGRSPSASASRIWRSAPTGRAEALDFGRLPGRPPHREGSALFPRLEPPARRLMWIDSHCHVSADEFAARPRAGPGPRAPAGSRAFVAIGAGYGVDANAGRGGARRATRGCVRRASACTRTTPRPGRRSGAPALRLARASRAWSRSASAGSTTGTSTRRATCSARSSPSRAGAARELAPLVRSTCARAAARGPTRSSSRSRRAESGGSEGVLHCFTHDLPFAKRALDAGLLVSFSGIVTFKTADELRAVAAALPLERVLDRDRRAAPRAAGPPRLAQRAGARRPRRRLLARGGRDPLERRGRRHLRRTRAGGVPPRRARRERGRLAPRARRRSRAPRGARCRRAASRDAARDRHEVAPVDLVTEVDHASRCSSRERMGATRPGDAVLAEEGGAYDAPARSFRWVVDPLDGTTNYAHGYPRFCVSIGVERDGAREVGVVYDPLRDELFTAGARRRGDAATARPSASPRAPSSSARCSRPASPTTCDVSRWTTSTTSALPRAGAGAPARRVRGARLRATSRAAGSRATGS